jgi:hypothetical protein
MQTSIQLAQKQNGNVVIRGVPEGGLMLIYSSILAGLAGWKPL